MVLNLEFLVLYNVRSYVELKGFGNKWLVLFFKRPLGITVGSTSKIRGQINTNFSDINLGPVDVADRSYARILNLVHSSATASTFRTRVLPRGILEAFRAFDTSYHSRIPIYPTNRSNRQSCHVVCRSATAAGQFTHPESERIAVPSRPRVPRDVHTKINKFLYF